MRLRVSTAEVSNSSEPTLSRAIAYYGRLYQEVREEALEKVFDAHRAMSFWSLKKGVPGFSVWQDKVAWRIGESTPSAFGITELTKAIKDVKAARSRVYEDCGRGPEWFPQSLAPDAGPDASSRSAVYVKITDADLLARIFNLMFYIPTFQRAFSVFIHRG